MPELDPGTSFKNDVIVVDGMWGSGKSILSSLIGSLEGVEKKRIDHIFEYVCVGHALGSISADLAMTLIRIQADLDQYNNLIGREVNFRPNDDSGLRNTPGSIRYLRRIIAREGDEVVERINEQNLALLLVTHHISKVSSPLVRSLSSRLFLIEVARHPLHLVKYWTTYFEDFERSREFTLCARIKGTRVPWFAFDWGDEFVRLSPIDRAIRCINFMQLAALSSSGSPNDSLQPANHKKYRLVIPFEWLVRQPDLILDEVAKFTGRDRTKRTTRAFIRQKIPRDGLQPGRRTNTRSWLPSPGLSQEGQNAELMTWVVQHADSTSIETMKTAVERYEKTFMQDANSTFVYLPLE